jgi:hypothetical protein
MGSTLGPNRTITHLNSFPFPTKEPDPEPVFQNSEYEVHHWIKLAQKTQEAKMSASKWEAVGVTLILCHTSNGACQTKKTYRSNYILKS